MIRTIGTTKRRDDEEKERRGEEEQARSDREDRSFQAPAAGPGRVRLDGRPAAADGIAVAY